MQTIVKPTIEADNSAIFIDYTHVTYNVNSSVYQPTYTVTLCSCTLYNVYCTVPESLFLQVCARAKKYKVEIFL